MYVCLTLVYVCLTLSLSLPRMDSYFLAETLKYLFLLFSPDHWMRKEPHVFNTEGPSYIYIYMHIGGLYICIYIYIYIYIYTHTHTRRG